MNEIEFLVSRSKDIEPDDPSMHDLEVCGMCFHRSLMRDVARDMLTTDDTTNAVIRWSEEVQRRWQAGKFYQLWQAERTAGRDPEATFAERGWEP